MSVSDLERQLLESRLKIDALIAVCFFLSQKKEEWPTGVACFYDLYIILTLLHVLVQKVDFAQRQLKEAERINTKVTADYVKGQEDIDALKKQLRTVDQLRERAKALA